MNTADLVTEISLLTPNWSRPRILGLLNNILKMALKTNLRSQYYVDPTTGDFPYLSTTLGTYLYSVNVSTIWSVVEIVTDSEIGAGMDSNSTADRFARPFSYQQKNYFTVPAIKVNQLGTAYPTVKFQFDPGTYTTRYRIIGCETPTEVLSEATEYPVDDKLRYTAVIPAVIALIEGFDHGNYIERLKYVQEELIPKITASVESPFQSINTEPYSY